MALLPSASGVGGEAVLQGWSKKKEAFSFFTGCFQKTHRLFRAAS